ncbi:hypothetical protein RhiirA4_448900 [Rhizophagus irregularis]|uniref:Galactose oxidase n=1 Tax=Rhizophagus irregularis TaxID=588596 RepID=A0A2I1HDT6_9GLOM|nr:hypothetical protein RhiirA4_448900 [Rhizophagus irregularis]
MIFLYNSLIYIIVFGAFLQLLVEVKSQLITYKPDLRYAHTATLIEDKIYILGGAVPADNGISPKETFLYLDVSTPFITNEVKYIDISNNNAVPSHLFAIATKGGANNSTLFLYGGESLGNQTKELVYTFDAQHSTWSVPKITGDPPKGTKFMFPVDYNELFYLFGGSGYGPNGFLPLNEVFLYDTINNSWERKETDGIVPTPRAIFSAVLGLGYMREDDNDILLLDISNNDEYAWTTSFVPPSLTSQLPTSQLPTSQSPTNSSSHSNINTIGGISIGVICGIALTVGGFFLYKQYKNRKERSTAISTPGNE